MYYYRLCLLGSPLNLLTYSSHEKLKENLLVSVKLRNRTYFGVVIDESEKPSFDVLDIEHSLNNYFSHQQAKIAGFISKYYFSSLGEALALFTPFSKDIISKAQEHIPTNIELSPRQNEALSFLKDHPVSLLFGDTGSGKTEIYMKYFEQILTQEKRALLLMPEISLTPQMQIRLEEHFGDTVVMWHSKLTKKNREKNLERIRSGQASIIAGARSALFLPIKVWALL